jgi:heme-degrading monooxygenase HmoA
MSIASTPSPPYYAAIFTSIRADLDEGYQIIAQRMDELAVRQPGFLGMESVSDAGVGITVSYWESLEAIAAWRRHAEHKVAQQTGRKQWYARYALRVAKVERAMEFDATGSKGADR